MSAYLLQEEYEPVAKSQIKKLTKICAREKMKEAEAAERQVHFIIDIQYSGIYIDK